MTGKLRIAVSVACAVAVMAVTSAYADNVRAEADHERDIALERYGGEVVDLVVAKQTIEAGDTVSQSNVEIREWLAALAPEGALTSLDDVIGKKLTEPAQKGAPVTSLNFREGSTGITVPSGHVAVTIPLTDRLGISRDVQVGSALVAYSSSDEGAKVVAGDVSVLAVSSTGKSVSTSGSLTVSVLPQDVEGLLVASTAGDLRLVVPAEDASGAIASIDPSAPTEVLPKTETASEDSAAGAESSEGETI